VIVDAHVHIFSHSCSKVSPPEYADQRFPVERLLALMDQEGVSKAMLVQNPAIGIINDEIACAVRDYPERFAGTAQVDPTDVAAAAWLSDYAAAPGIRALKFEMSQGWGWTGKYPDLQLDQASLDPLWKVVSDLDLVAIIDPGPPGNFGYQVERIATLSERLPETNFLIEHLGYLTADLKFDAVAKARRLDLLRLALRRNVYLGFSAVGTLLEEPFPCAGTLELLRNAVELVGAHKILWGTDAPYTLRDYSYGEMIDVVRTHATFLSDRDRGLILGGNALQMFFAEPGVDRVYSK
jgi:predicted TIM-barrel fold metal-dependent hydrolase